MLGLGWKRLRRSTLLMFLGIASVMGVFAAAILLPQITVNNNVTVTSGVGLGVATFTANPTTCPVLGNTGYGTVTPFTNTVAWSITAGGSQTQFFCIENQGSGTDAVPSIVLGTIPSTITCTTAPCLTLTTVPSSIPALAAQSVSSPIAVTLTASSTTTGSGTVPVIVS